MIPGLSEASQAFILGALAEERKVEKAVLFGSRATGRFTAGSDVDIALLGRDLTEADRFSLARIFDDSNLPYKIDLLILDDAVSDSLKEHIASVGKELVLPRL